jgi:hypothetical protein
MKLNNPIKIKKTNHCPFFQKFEETYMSDNPAKKVNEKKKRDAFKKLISGIITVRLLYNNYFYFPLMVALCLSHAKISRGFVKNRLKITSETKD